ncbi:hypothetical protein BDW02DRAFT_512614 [Decorospora gaudefroyi]|uniref:Uncharacterized protein n=1 Tax=Decorospora gaudefroyi TaxID=184978 RepID=A0A6A5JWI4_9PLEO|nr:hypothetical protein BDW02DRAFT_512614 [Decorospora gaudefroyi]
MTGDLISLSDDEAISPSHAMSANRPNTGHHDSFSDLARMMKAKKPYTPIAPPIPLSLPLPLTSTQNGTRFSSRSMAAGSILSPRAVPFEAPVAAYLQKQERLLPLKTSPPRVPEYRKQNMAPLEPLYEANLISGLESPARIGPTSPPTPVESFETLPASLSAPEPIVRSTTPFRDGMTKALDALSKQKRELEMSLAKRKSQEHHVDVQLDKLRYQNEANKGQKAFMGRVLAQKEMEIQKQQLEIDELARKLEEAESKLKQLGAVAGELDYLRKVKASADNAHEQSLQDLAASKDRELEAVRDTIQALEQSVEQVTRERDTALSIQANPGHHINRVEDLTDTLAKREQMVNSLRHQLLDEKIRVNQLEDKVDILEEQSCKKDMDDLKSKLREKTSMCDRQRNQLKMTEAHLKVSQERLLRTGNHAELLQGGAHLVKPNEQSKLPKAVYSCSECYAKNFQCDDEARCRSCKDANTVCARWRCSLKHRLGDCHLAPCKFPHDSQGWLVLETERPQW